MAEPRLSVNAQGRVVYLLETPCRDSLPIEANIGHQGDNGAMNPPHEEYILLRASQSGTQVLNRSASMGLAM